MTDKERETAERSENAGDAYQEWKRYTGNIPINCDGSSNRGAFDGLIATLSKPGKDGFKVNTVANEKWASGKYTSRMKLKNLKIDRCVGSGEFGILWKAKLGGEQDVSVQQINVRKRSSASIWMERDALIYLKSDGSRRVVNLVGAFFDVDAFLITELCLSYVSVAIGRISDKVTARFMIQLLQGLEFIHSKSIWHCDLRPENLLITTNNNLVIANFGKAIYAPGLDKVYCSSTLGLSYYSDSRANCENLFSTKTDVWAAGCTVYELATGKCLMRYDNQNDVPKSEYGQIALLGKQNNYSKDSPDNMRTPLEQQYPTRFARVLRQMLAPLWEERLEAKTIINGRVLADLCQKLEIDVMKIDNDPSDIFAMEPLQRAAPPSFKILTEVDPAATLTTNLCGLYYDEDENVNQLDTAPTFYRPLASQSGADFIRCLQAQGLIEDFVKANNNNDPICFASCAYVSEKSLRVESLVTLPSCGVGSEQFADKPDYVQGRKNLMPTDADVCTEPQDKTAGTVQEPKSNRKDAGSSTVITPNHNPASTQVLASGSFLSLDRMGTFVSREGHVITASEQSPNNGKHHNSEDHAFTKPQTLLQPISYYCSPTKSRPKEIPSTSNSHILASDGHAKISVSVPTSQKISRGGKLVGGPEDKTKHGDGQDKRFELPANLFSPLATSSPTKPTGLSCLRKSLTRRSLSPARLAPTSSQAAIPTSKPVPPLPQPPLNTRGIQRGRSRGSPVRGTARRGGSTTAKGRIKSPEDGNIARRGTSLGGVDRQRVSPYHGVDHQAESENAVGRGASPDDGPSDDGMDDCRGVSFARCGERSDCGINRRSDSGAAEGRSGFSIVAEVNRGKASPDSSSQKKQNDPAKIKQKNEDHVEARNLQGAKTTRRVRSSAEFHQRSDEIDPTKQSKPSSSQRKVIIAAAKYKSSEPTIPAGPNNPSTSRKRPQTGASKDGSGAVKKLRKDNCGRKDDSMSSGETLGTNFGNNTSNRPLQYTCSNHDRGCQFRGNRDSVSAHMENCELNSSEEESYSSSD